jgi:predicted Zn-dependent protease
MSLKTIRHAVCVIAIVSLASITGCSVSDRQIVQQADTAHAALKPAVIEDRELADYIQSIGDRIVKAAHEADTQEKGPESHFKDKDREWMFSRNMQFHFVNSKTLNAFTTGGEHMYIYTALFQLCQDENDLAAVMSHEYAHVYSRHVQKGTQRQYGIIGAALLAGGAGYVAGGKEKGAEYASAAGGGALALGQLAGTQFTRGDEAEADKWGFYFYTHAGWDPQRFGHFFQLMIDKGYDKGVSYLSDHPSLSSRVEAANKRAQELGRDADRYRRPPVADAGRFRDLQRRAASVGRNMPDDQSLAKAQKLLAAFPRSCLTPAVQADQIQAKEQLQRDLEAQEKKRTSRSGDQTDSAVPSRHRRSADQDR